MSDGSSHDWVNISLAAKREGDTLNATLAIRRAIVLTPEDSRPYLILYNIGPPIERIGEAAKAYFLNPLDHPNALRYAAASCLIGDFRRSLSVYERVIAACPENVAARLQFHSAQRKAGLTEASADGLSELYIADPDNWNLFHHAIEAAGALGDFLLVEKIWSIAKTKFPRADRDRLAGGIRRCQAWMTGGHSENAPGLPSFLGAICEDGNRHLVIYTRHPNDLDHQAPIVFQWTKDPSRFCTIVFLDLEEVAPSGSVNALINIFKNLPRVFQIRLADVAALVRTRDVFEGILQLLSPLDVRTIHVSDGAPSWFASRYRAAAEALGQNFVALPHGETAILNHMQQVTQLTLPAVKTKEDRYYSHRVFSNKWAKAEFESDGYRVDGSRVAVLGSARYSEEWVNYLSSILPAYKLMRDGRLVVAVFLIRERYNIWQAELQRTLQMLRRIPDVLLIVQKHPRRSRDIDVDSLERVTLEHPEHFDWLDNVQSESASSEMLVVPDGIPGSVVVRAADVCLTFGSSISLDAVRLGKPCLELSYLHANRTLIQRYLAESDMRCREDVLNCIQTFTATKDRSSLGTIFYQKESRRRFLEDVVSAGKSDSLTEYADLLEEWTHPLNRNIVCE